MKIMTAEHLEGEPDGTLFAVCGPSDRYGESSDRLGELMLKTRTVSIKPDHPYYPKDRYDTCLVRARRVLPLHVVRDDHHNVVDLAADEDIESESMVRCQMVAVWSEEDISSLIDLLRGE